MLIKMKTVLAISALSLAHLVGAATYYVDCTKPDDSGDGKSEATAKKSINAAIGLCAESGDTVIVLPGDYRDDAPAAVTGATTPCRVAIEGKKVYLKSRDGKRKTRITGAYSTDASANVNCGPGAVRCVGVAGAKAKGTVIEGFTLYRGATLRAEGAGGYWTDSNVNDELFVQDCDIVACCGDTTAAANRRGTALRCTFSRNRGHSNDTVCALDCGNYVHCVITGTEGTYYVTQTGVNLYNCTIVCNSGSVLTLGSWNSTCSTYYNCLSCMNQSNGPHTGGAGNPCNFAYNSACSDAGKFIGGAEDSITNAFSGFQVMSPLSGDFRLTSDSVAKNLGKADWLGNLGSLNAPSQVDFYKDYNGNPVPTSGVIHAGAVQEVATAASNSPENVTLFSANSGIVLNDFPRSLVTATGRKPWMLIDRAPCQVKLSRDFAAGSVLYYKLNATETAWFPTADGTAYMTIPQKTSTLLSLREYLAERTYYVDCTQVDDSGDGLSAATAKRTIQAAVDAVRTAAATNSLILVAPGVYDQGGAVVGGLLSRVGFPAGQPRTCIRSTGGKEATVIKGAADVGGDANGLGDNAVRCVGFEADYCSLYGFTLTGGHTAGASASADTMKQGAGVYSSSKSAFRRVIADCIVTNNVGSSFGGTYQASAYRSLFRGNRSLESKNGDIYYNSVFGACALREDAGRAYSVRNACLFANCSVDWAGAPTSATFFETTASYLNSVLNNCRSIQLYNANSKFFGNVIYGSTFNLDYGNASLGQVTDYSYVTLDPALANTAGLDFRPANPNVVTEISELVQGDAWQYVDRDLEGRPYTFNAEGHFASGALQTLCPSFFVEGPLDAHFELVNVKEGYNAALENVTYEVVAPANRPFHGFIVNGVRQDPSIVRLTLGVPNIGQVITLDSRVLSSDWYVDANDGNDAYNGYSPATAMKTLAAIMPLVSAGDTVHAAPGDYKDGTMTYDGAFYNAGDEICTISSRVVVPKNVALVADAGAAVTFITGQETPGAELGLGAASIRCVTLVEGASIRGFTLRNGHTDRISGDDDGNGGGLLQLGFTSFAYDCTFTNCCAYRGGAACNAILRNCRIFDSKARNGAGVFYGWAYGCLFDHFHTNVRVFNAYREMVNCTFGRDITKSDGTAPTDVVSPNGVATDAYPGYFCNNVMMVPFALSSNHTPITNCLLLANLTLPTCVDCAFTESFDGIFDGYQPLPGTGCGALGLVDGNANLAWAEGKDVFGKARVSNNAVDAGAVQSVWNAHYAKMLQAGKFICTAASPESFEVIGRAALDLNGGEMTLVAKPGKKGKVQLGATVTGTGSLVVYRNGEVAGTYTAVDSPVSLVLDIANATVRLVHVPGAGDVGTVVINEFATPNAFVLSFR